MITSAPSGSILQNIKSLEEYEAVSGLLNLLKKLDVKSAVPPLKELVYAYGDIFERCDMCQDPLEACRCNHEEYNDRIGIYSDDSSFE